MNQRVSASTQNQAMNALVFLYKHVLKKELGAIDAVRVRRPKRLPVVLTREEAQKVLSLPSGVNHLIVSVLYGIAKPAGCHTMQHCFATHLLESGMNIRTVQKLLEHKDVKTTMIYTHVMQKQGITVRSPLDT